MRAALLVVVALAQLSYARQALDLGRTRDDALFEAFNRGYELPPGQALDRAEIVTEFRRAVLIVRDHASAGEYGFSERDLAKAMEPFAGLVTFVAQARLNPLHTFVSVPPYDLYVSTGPATRPLAPKPMKRDPVYPPGMSLGSAVVAVRLEGTFRRADLEKAVAPMLTVTDEKADILWQARIDLSRYR